MKIVQLKITSYSSRKNSPRLEEEESDSNNFNIELDGAVMKLAFFLKGMIHLESGNVVFKIKNNQVISLAETYCFS